MESKARSSPSLMLISTNFSRQIQFVGSLYTVHALLTTIPGSVLPPYPSLQYFVLTTSNSYHIDILLCDVDRGCIDDPTTDRWFAASPWTSILIHGCRSSDRRYQTACARASETRPVRSHVQAGKHSGNIRWLTWLEITTPSHLLFPRQLSDLHEPGGSSNPRGGSQEPSKIILLRKLEPGGRQPEAKKREIYDTCPLRRGLPLVTTDHSPSLPPATSSTPPVNLVFRTP